jgi:hypothetical protein
MHFLSPYVPVGTLACRMPSRSGARATAAAIYTSKRRRMPAFRADFRESPADSGGDRTGWLPWKDSNRSASISNRSQGRFRFSDRRQAHRSHSWGEFAWRDVFGRPLFRAQLRIIPTRRAAAKQRTTGSQSLRQQRAVVDGIDVAAMFAEGHQLDAERKAWAEPIRILNPGPTY